MGSGSGCFWFGLLQLRSSWSFIIDFFMAQRHSPPFEKRKEKRDVEAVRGRRGLLVAPYVGCFGEKGETTRTRKQTVSSS